MAATHVAFLLTELCETSQRKLSLLYQQQNPWLCTQVKENVLDTEEVMGLLRKITKWGGTIEQ